MSGEGVGLASQRNASSCHGGSAVCGDWESCTFSTEMTWAVCFVCSVQDHAVD